MKITRSVPLLAALLAMAGIAASAQNYSTDGKSYAYVSSGDGVPPVVLQFTGADRAHIDTMEEDLSIMTRLIEKNLERGLGEEKVSFKMNIPMLLTSGSRSIRAMYVEGMGALFMVKVNFPLLPPPKVEEKKPEPDTDSEWNRTRKEMLGQTDGSLREFPVREWRNSIPAYNEEQVESLRKELLQTLKFASNIRNLPASEYVSITVFGAEGTAAVTGGGSGGSPSKSSNKRRTSSNSFGSSGGGSGVAAGSGSASEPETAPPTPPTPSVTVRPGGGVSVSVDAGQPPSALPGGSGFYGVSGGGGSGRVSSSDLKLDAKRGSSTRGSVLTIRAKKSDVDAFAKGKLDYEEFRKKAEMQTYVGNGTGVTSVNSWAVSNALNKQ